MPLGAVSAADWGLKTIPHSTQKELMLLHQLFEAESEGFEPPDPLRSTVFKTAAFDHSANSPICFPFVRDCKGTNKFETCKLFFNFFDKRSLDKLGRTDYLPSSCAKNLYWNSKRYIAPQVTQLSAKLKTAPKNVRG